MYISSRFVEGDAIDLNNQMTLKTINSINDNVCCETVQLVT